MLQKQIVSLGRIVAGWLFLATLVHDLDRQFIVAIAPTLRKNINGANPIR